MRNVVLAALILLGSAAFDRVAEAEIPQRSVAAAALLENAQWSEIESGLELLRASASGLEITAFRIDQSRFRFQPVVQRSPEGERARNYAEREGAIRVISLRRARHGEREQHQALYG